MVADPEQYVNDNEEVLLRIIKHSSDEFVRALALAALIEYGDDPTIETVIDELQHLEENTGRESDR